MLLPPAAAIRDPLGIMNDVAARVGRDVDLVDLRTAGDVLRRDVLESGRVLYASDPDTLLSWEATALSRYSRHREEIRRAQRRRLRSMSEVVAIS